MSALTGPRAGGGRRRAPMLARAVGWDLRLLARHQVITVAAVVTAAYAAAFRALPASRATEVVVVLVFSDPTMIGFLFVGVMVLFERGAGTLDAVVVTPLSPSQYLWSKALALTAVAVPCGLVMAVAARGMAFDAVWLVAGVALTSALFVLIGFVAVARVRTVNAYLLLVPLFLVPLNLPFLGFLGVVESPLLYLLPTQASLVLLESAFAARPAWELVYAVVLLAVSCAVALRLALRAFALRVRGSAG